MRTILLATLLCFAAFATTVSAQESAAMPEPSKPQKEHAWLEQFVGEWTTESEANMGPDAPPVKCHGTMSTQMLGRLWIVLKGKGEAMGTTVDTMQTIGFDSEKKEFVGVWVDSMWNYMWHYRGSLDAAGKVLTMEAEGPNFMGDAGATAKFRDTYELKSANEIAVSSSMQDEKGKWVTFMTGTMTRKR